MLKDPKLSSPRQALDNTRLSTCGEVISHGLQGFQPVCGILHTWSLQGDAVTIATESGIGRC